MLSDSGTLSEESAILGFPAVLIRTSTERPEALDAGTIVIGGVKTQDVEQALELAVNMFKQEGVPLMAKDYHAPDVATKVIKIIQSYTEIVNTTVWLKK